MIRIIVCTLLIFIPSILLQHFLEIKIGEELISTLLTVFAIFFGFYTTSFGVFATSKYLSKLNNIEDENNSSNTLLDVLLNEFKSSTLVLLCSILYLVLFLVATTNQYELLLSCLSVALWGVIFTNLYYAFNSLMTFISVTRQSAACV